MGGRLNVLPDVGGDGLCRFVIDAYSRRIIGWRTASHTRASLVTDALEHAIWTRRQAGRPVAAGLICHSDAGSQYVSLACTERLADAGALPSVGSVGDAFDNALAETTIGFFKTTELEQPTTVTTLTSPRREPSTNRASGHAGAIQGPICPFGDNALTTLNEQCEPGWLGWHFGTHSEALSLLKESLW